MLTEVPLLAVGQLTILDRLSAPMGPAEIQRCTETFVPKRRGVDCRRLAGGPGCRRRGMARGDGAGEGGALAQALEARAATIPPAGACAVVLSAGKDKMRFLGEDPQAGLRLGVRVHLSQGHIDWTIAVPPGPPVPYPLSEILVLLGAEAAANRRAARQVVKFGVIP